VILSDTEIRRALSTHRIVIEPRPEPDQFTSSAMDLRLGKNFFQWIPGQDLQAGQPAGVYRPIIIDPANITDPHKLFSSYLRRVTPTEANGSYHLKPREFILAETLETVTLPRESKLAARVEGRSTLARCGLIVHMTAPIIHAGFSGIIVLEVCNFGEHPIKLTPGLRCCQLIFEMVAGKPSREPATSYQGQRGISRK